MYHPFAVKLLGIPRCGQGVPFGTSAVEKIHLDRRGAPTGALRSVATSPSARAPLPPLLSLYPLAFFRQIGRFVEVALPVQAGEEGLGSGERGFCKWRGNTVLRVAMQLRARLAPPRRGGTHLRGVGGRHG
eukprot:scaffold166212_cov28-Tisochrysis_lutea.AAC.5